MKNQRKALWLAILPIALLTVRWVFVAGIGEYGMMYDQAYRLSIGQVWYRDLLSTHPPIAAHVLGWLFRLTPPSLLLYNVHLYLWWLASIFVGYLLLRRYDIRGWTRCAALVSSAALSLPCLTPGHAYFYAAGVFCGLFVLCFDIGLGTNRRGWMFSAGMLAGAAMFARQNLAAAMIGGIGFLYLLSILRRSIDYRKASTEVALMICGFILSFGGILLIFSRTAGASEVLHELLLDGAHGKAGEYGLLARLIPRINLKAGLAHRRIAELVASVIVYSALLLWMARRKAKPVANRETGAFKLLLMATVILIAANFLTLVPVDNVNRWFDSSTWPAIPTATLALTDLLNIAWLSGMLWLLVSSWKSISEKQLARGALACFVFAGTIVSSQSYSVQLAPILVPLTIAVLGPEFSRVAVIRGLSLLTAVWAASCVVSFPATFERLAPIPGPRQFAGVFAPESYIHLTTEILGNVTPEITGKTVLWIAIYGPHAAFGGIPAPNVVPWDKTTFTSRQVAYLLRRWQADPPRYVILGPFWGDDDLQFGPESGFRQWLNTTYSKGWCSSLQPGLCLWREK